ncbi:MAG: hypothetical protein B6D72_09770 [gamma proteobacterium symbiont of Ctena orbiculata]|uniref:Uncharacterized protein n=1 Tax=Candidatus Thiodiazotropha taylori TaxID=2792791 RepID=A0A944MAQ3_9GAMM|nr:hypothetical protein [Candidatus Thiodiazotropha taylori]PUB83851.1 MAG: hypothetical protein DBP00_15740 [gamma proteobacterium symbiont of Ctena orbiculata]MBT2988448.1 hypothetical protein [Candidatus Thiodiazotropha taylori]MBT2997355.1 hypothetical protein [Candidatus Thiodiazotropha taylori]MBT3000935.1 hypothetical protein [Candidatus Thiodiazotropha taylori]
MQLNLIIDDWSMNLEIPDGYLASMQDSFEKMDRDMDRGWQIGQRWVRDPDSTQRCQLVAGKLLTALETDNEQLALMMGGYILSRMPDVKQVVIDNTGSPEETSFSNR